MGKLIIRIINLLIFFFQENQYHGGFEYSGNQLNLDQTPKHYRGLGLSNINRPTNLHLQPLPPLDPGQYLTSHPTLPPAHYVTTTAPATINSVDYNNGKSNGDKY